MPEPETEVDKAKEQFRSFRYEVTLVLVGLFLALGVQNIVQYVEASSPHITPYFYLGVGVVSLFMVLVFLNLAAGIAGLKEYARRRWSGGKTQIGRPRGPSPDAK